MVMSRYTITGFLWSAKGDIIPVMNTGNPHTINIKMYYNYNSRGDVAIYDKEQFWQLRRGSRDEQRLGQRTPLPNTASYPIFAVNDTQYVMLGERDDYLYMHWTTGMRRPAPIQSTYNVCGNSSWLSLTDTRVYISTEYIPYCKTTFTMCDTVADRHMVKAKFQHEMIMTTTDGDIVYFISREDGCNTMQLYDTRMDASLVNMGFLCGGYADNIRANAQLCGDCHLVQIALPGRQHVLMHDMRACASYNCEDFYQPVFVVYI